MVNTPPAVRVLPMDSDEEEFRGRCVAWVQARFFLGRLPSRSGRYLYHQKGLHADPGTIVLFQFDSQIIASAVLDRVERFPQPDGPFHGALWFDPRSIRIFEPVEEAVVQGMWQEFPGFSNVKQNLEPPSHYPAFAGQLRGVAAPMLAAPGS